MPRLLTASVIAFFLTACTDLFLMEATPGQRLYAADGGYKAMLELAVAYKDACLARPVMQQFACRPIVEKIKVIDQSYGRLRSRLDGAAPSESDVRIVEAVIGELRLALASANAEGVTR